MKDVILRYSEWLDSQGLIVGDAESDDDRTHEELVEAFLVELGICPIDGSSMPCFDCGAGL